MTYKEFEASRPIYFYQPVWREFTGFGDDPDYVGEKVSDQIFLTPEEADEYGKKHCPRGYTYSWDNKLKLIKGVLNEQDIKKKMANKS